MDDVKDDMKNDVKKDEKQGEQVDSTKTFFIALAVLVLLLLGIFLIPRFFDQGVQTLGELHTENLNNGDSDTAYVYNGYSFVHYDGLWYTQILDQFSQEVYDVPLHYGPRDLTDVIVYGDLNQFFAEVSQGDINGSFGRYYLTFDPDNENMSYVALAAGELSQNLVTTFNMAPVSACTSEGEGCNAVPIVTCDNTDDPVIYLAVKEPTVVYANGNCITIQGTQEQLVRAVDRFLLKLYNVMI